jgi:origin recognition complex subunit 3
LIVTGPNIASQELLFSQLAERLKSHIHGPVVILRSTDASNLKTLLKKVIRDATNQKEDEEDELQMTSKDVSALKLLVGYLLICVGSETAQLRPADPA